jgi:cold shock CspA family protein
VDRNGKYFTSAICEETGESVFIHEKSLSNGLNYDDFEQGDKVSFELQEPDGNLAARKTARPDYDATNDWVNSIHRGLYVPFIKIWSDGRSITDRECPKEFFKAAAEKLDYLTTLLSQAEIPQPIKEEILFLLSCTHKDTTNTCRQWIHDQVQNGHIDNPKAVGFVLGNVSEQWQKDVLSKLLINISDIALNVFACSIWREKHFVDYLTLQNLTSITQALLSRLNKMVENKMLPIRLLELLLGLLRTRASSDPEIRMLLQPNQKLTKEFAKQVELVAKIVTKSNDTLSSRVQLNIKKPEGDRTPDLLYALRLYLTGDDGANAIHVSGVSDVAEGNMSV